MRESLGKIAELKKITDTVWQQEQRRIMIQVDGGINATTGKDVVHHGADCLVAGSFLFKSTQMAADISQLKSR